MATIVYPLVFTVVGALVYGFGKDKPAEMGRLTFFAGVLGLLWALHGSSLHL